MGHPVAGAVDDGADMRIGCVEEWVGSYGAGFFVNLVAVLDGMAHDLTSARRDIKHEVPHAEHCFENPWNRALADCIRKHGTRDRDYGGLRRLNHTRLHVIRHPPGFRLERTSESEDELVHWDIVYLSDWRILHRVRACPEPRHGGFDPNIRVGREEVRALLVLFRARLRLKGNPRIVQCVSKVEFPKHRGHRQRGSLRGAGVQEHRAVAPQSLHELAAPRVVSVSPCRESGNRWGMRSCPA